MRILTSSMMGATCGWIVVLAPAVSASATAAELTLSQPLSYQVVQRDERNQGAIPIQATWTGRVTRVEARWDSMGGVGVGSPAWVCVCSNAAGGTLAGSLPAPAGGWYRVAVRAFDGDREVATQAVEKVGVGEVFIMAGQSNAGNFGWPRTAPLDDRVATHCQWCKVWRRGYDPQPWAHGGTGGSPWPAMGDGLVRALNVPVALLPVAAGGTSVSNWLPSSKACYGSLKRVMEFAGPHGARAILWHQGESDAFLGTSAEDYAKGMGEIIGQSRKDAGWDIPWGIALASFFPDNPNNKPKKGSGWIENGVAVRQGQKQAWLGKAVFEGPLTDDMIGPEWRHDTIHFSGKGLREHGRRWATQVLKSLFPNVPTNAVSPTGDAMAFVSPMPGFVAQRDVEGQGEVPVSGVFDGALSRIEACWTPMQGGTPSPWTVVADNPVDGIVSGKLRLPAGWYKLAIRGLREGHPVVARTIERVGVGEVFVVVGGESVANFGRAPQAARDPRVSGYCMVCYEQPMRDPLRGAVGSQGSSWPAMGDALAAALDLPVEIVVVGYSGSIAQWKPGTSLYHGGILSTLVYSRRFPKGGYRAVLWEVGELDAKIGTSATNYVATLNTIVSQARQDTRWDMPWVIGGVAYHPEASVTNQLAIREAQWRVCDGKTVFEGATADDLTGPEWRYDGIHFTEAGLQEHGRRWADVLQTLFFRETPAQ